MNLANYFYENFDEFLNLNVKIFSGYDLLSSYKFCEHIAKKHYENFPVGSILLPRDRRRFLYSIYAFARFADDIADSDRINLSTDERLRALTILEENLKELQNNPPVNNPIFLALKDTIEKKELPIEPFLRLITAFKMDVNFEQPDNWDALEYYCFHSANPVGELVLRVFGEYNERTITFSNQICTGLQLVNFWQDLSIDLKKGRIYIPKSIFENYRCDVSKIFEEGYKEKVNLVLKDILERTNDYFLDGWKLVWLLTNNRLKFEISAIIYGGVKVLKKEFRLGYNLLFKRPKLNFFDYFNIFLKSVL
jgi:squalene synthase HpnC